MQLAKSIKFSTAGAKTFLAFLLLSPGVTALAQNSPYSRFGLGDPVSPSNITTRGMGGISAAFADPKVNIWHSINFNNPASYSQFFTLKEPRSNKLALGRMVLDAGVNLESRSLVEPNSTQRFSSSAINFSYIQIGIPLKQNWGISFGIRPLTSINYKVNRRESINNPVTGEFIDSAVTQLTGSGGSFLPTIGTGFAIGNLSLGINASYLFGRQEFSRKKFLLNDSVTHYPSDHTANTSFGGLFFNGGLQYKIDLKNGKYLRLGAAGNWSQTIKASQDSVVRTFTFSSSGELQSIDSIYQKTDLKGEIVYPSQYTFGFVLGQEMKGWLVGVDYSIGQWNEFRSYGNKDSVQNNWRLQAGGQFRPKATRNYFSIVTYRAGFFFGQDYIKVKNDLPVIGGSFGATFPIRSRTQLTRDQINAVNVAFEFYKRGNNDNTLKENNFRLSVGFNFSDLWFRKRKYD